MNYKNNNDKEKALPVNEQIRAPRLQVIDHEGVNLGVISREEALRRARDAQLDLVVVSLVGKDSIPTAKIVDYGKVLYAKKKKLGEAKKHQKMVQIKEIKLRPKIGEHDYLNKMKQAAQFLKDGKHVKITLVFRGREMITVKDRSAEMFDRIDKTFQEAYGLHNVMHEKESKAGSQWSRIYTLKK